MTPLPGAGNTEVLIFATGLDLVQPSSDINCARLAVGNVSSISTNFWTLKAEYVRTLTFFRVMDNNINKKGSVFIKLFYTLRLVERESTSVKNTMHIAVWRNVSTAYAVCEEYIQSTNSNITEMRMGTLEFTEAFKAECTLTSFCHFRYAQQGNGMHFMTSCDVATQNAARVWLRLALGVVHDDGHVMQLCRLSRVACRFRCQAYHGL